MNGAEESVWDYTPPAVVPPTAAEDAAFCKNLATEASPAEFDPRTRTRMFAAAYDQCLNFYHGHSSN